MSTIGAFLILFGVILIVLADEASTELAKRCKNDADAFSKQVTMLSEKVRAQEKFAIIDIEDRDVKGRFDTPNSNPHTGSPIVNKWTAYEDADGHVLYGRKYKHKPDKP